MKKLIFLFTTSFLILLVSCNKNGKSTNDANVIDIQIGPSIPSSDSDICGVEALIGYNSYNTISGEANINIEVYEGQTLKKEFKKDNILIFKTKGKINDPTKTVTFPIVVKGLKMGTGNKLFVVLEIKHKCNNVMFNVKHKTSTVPGDPPYINNTIK